MARTRYGDTGVIYCEENLERLSRLPSESVDMIYLDPPFFSNKNYEVIWGDEAEVRSFEDRWAGGIKHYVRWMRERLMEARHVLKRTGTIYVHCDWHASHYLKVMMDGEHMFDRRNFRNEIVWAYRGGGTPRKDFARRHDVILRYSKTKDYDFYPDEIRIPYQAEGLGRTDDAMWGKHKGTNKVYKPHPLGKVPEDWWPMNPLNANDPERIGYPTQKPESLLERIIKASSKRGDVILDPFCGCGTTLAVAERLGRRWIGIDISPTAAEIMKIRLKKMGAEDVEVIGEPTTEAELRKLKPFEFQNWVIRRVDGAHSPRKTGDMGIDGFSFLDRLPIQVKRSTGVGRNVVDNFETAVERYGADKGYIVAFSFTKGAYDETARVEEDKGLKIELVTVNELLKGTPELVAPVLNRRVLELPRSRPKEARPTAEELIESDLEAGEVA
jgi:DNA modification methylase